jgi:RNA polymerase sigma-70 factor (ECF subfamily)
MGSTIEPMPAPPSEIVLTSASALEDELIAFFGTEYPRMTRLASLVCHAGQSPEDAVQAAMERAWRSRGTLRDRKQLRRWLDRIVVREAIRLNRTRWWSRWGTTDDERAPLLADPHASLTPDRVALEEAFALIPVEQRAAIVLHLHVGYSVAETAELMGSSVETTRSRLRLGRRRLQTRLSEDES